MEVSDGSSGNGGIEMQSSLKSAWAPARPVTPNACIRVPFEDEPETISLAHDAYR